MEKGHPLAVTLYSSQIQINLPQRPASFVLPPHQKMTACFTLSAIEALYLMFIVPGCSQLKGITTMIGPRVVLIAEQVHRHKGARGKRSHCCLHGGRPLDSYFWGTRDQNLQQWQACRSFYARGLDEYIFEDVASHGCQYWLTSGMDVAWLEVGFRFNNILYRLLYCLLGKRAFVGVYKIDIKIYKIYYIWTKMN